MPQGDLKPKRNQHKKYRNEFVHHIATFNSQRCGFGWDLSHYAANMIFSNRAPLSKQSIDEQGLDVDYIKTRFVKGQFAVFIFVLIVIIQQLFH
jgi:hypothetical protein